MTEHNPKASQEADVWDNYWHGDRNDAAWSGRRSRHPVILSFWDDYFRALKDRDKTPRIVDIGSGGGRVLNSAKIAFEGSPVNFTCLDISASAISTIEQEFPEVKGIVADARSIPLNSAAYDIATSQFGLEYAGLEAIDEVARLIAPGGQLALLLHHRDGHIYRRCHASLKALKSLQDSGFFPHAITLFEEGFAAVQGADRAGYEAAGRQFQLTLREVESILDEHGQDVADGTIVNFVRAILQIHGQIQHHEPEQVLEWLRNMQGQVESFIVRMASMCEVAVDAEVFDELCVKVGAKGFEIVRGNALSNPQDGEIFAWALIAARA